MKKFIIRGAAFIGILCLLVSLCMGYISKKVRELNGPNYEEQIEISFEGVSSDYYETIALGNSRIYRGINPHKLDSKTYNFAHDNDSFNQIYYKLLYLKKIDKLPKEILMGVDYFQFSVFSDTRNHVYKKYFEDGYMKDYNFDLNTSFNNYMIFTQNRINLWLDWLQGLKEYNMEEVPYMTDRGQYILYGMAKENEKVTRESTLLPVQQEYFDKILEFCEENNIKVKMIMMPTRATELESYTEETIKEFDEYFKSKESNNIKYLNFARDSRFVLKDYQDKTHLNKDGADKFSEILNGVLGTFKQ